jgi:hypothetical protein
VPCWIGRQRGAGERRSLAGHVAVICPCAGVGELSAELRTPMPRRTVYRGHRGKRSPGAMAKPFWAIASDLQEGINA